MSYEIASPRERRRGPRKQRPVPVQLSGHVYASCTDDFNVVPHDAHLARGESQVHPEASGLENTRPRVSRRRAHQGEQLDVIHETVNHVPFGHGPVGYVPRGHVPYVCRSIRSCSNWTLVDPVGTRKKEKRTKGGRGDAHRREAPAEQPNRRPA